VRDILYDGNLSGNDRERLGIVSSIKSWVQQGAAMRYGCRSVRPSEGDAISDLVLVCSCFATFLIDYFAK
jgi:hypothetical protein